MTFDQSSWQLHHSKVYNVAGDLHLTEQSGPREFAAVVESLRERLGTLEGVPDDEQSALDEELADIAASASSDGSDEADTVGDPVAGRLTRLAVRLRALRGTATAAAALGGSVDELARWAGAHF